MLVKKLKFFSGLIEFSLAWFKLYIISLEASDQENLDNYLSLEASDQEVRTSQLPECGSQRSRKSYLTTTWVWKPAIKKFVLYNYLVWEPTINKILLDNYLRHGTRDQEVSTWQATWAWKPAIKKIALDNYLSLGASDQEDHTWLRCCSTD